jgi:hypothetical protein
MTIGEPAPELIGGKKMAYTWALKEENARSAEADSTVEGFPSSSEGRYWI